MVCEHEERELEALAEAQVPRQQHARHSCRPLSDRRHVLFDAFLEQLALAHSETISELLCNREVVGLRCHCALRGKARAQREGWRRRRRQMTGRLLGNFHRAIFSRLPNKMMKMHAESVQSAPDEDARNHIAPDKDAHNQRAPDEDARNQRAPDEDAHNQKGLDLNEAVLSVLTSSSQFLNVLEHVQSLETQVIGLMTHVKELTSKIQPTDHILSQVLLKQAKVDQILVEFTKRIHSTNTIKSDTHTESSEY